MYSSSKQQRQSSQKIQPNLKEMTSDIVVLDRQRLNRKEYQFRRRDFSQSNLMSPSSCQQSKIGAQPEPDKLQLSNLSNRLAAFSSYNTYSHRSFTMQAP